MSERVGKVLLKFAGVTLGTLGTATVVLDVFLRLSEKHS